MDRSDYREGAGYVREALARDERRIRRERQGNAIVLGGVALGLGAWTAATNGILVAVNGAVWLGAMLIAAGAALGAVAVVVIIAGVRRRRSGFAEGDKPGSAQGKPNAAFDHDPRLHPTPPPYLNQAGSGGLMGGN